MKTEIENLLKDKSGSFSTRTDTEGRTRVDFSISDFPGVLFSEWDKDCKEQYNDMRWLKMYCDHLVANGKDADRDLIVQDVLAIIESQQMQQPKKEERKDERVSTLTGKYG